MHNISVGCHSRLARSPGGLGGREPVAAQSPERSFFFPLFLSAEKEKEVIVGDEVGKSLLKVTLPTSGKAEPYMISRVNFWGESKWEISGEKQGNQTGRQNRKTVIQ